PPHRSIGRDVLTAGAGEAAHGAQRGRRDADLGHRAGLERESAEPGHPELWARHAQLASALYGAGVRARTGAVALAAGRLRLVLEARRREQSRPGLVLVSPGRP